MPRFVESTNFLPRDLLISISIQKRGVNDAAANDYIYYAEVCSSHNSCIG